MARLLGPVSSHCPQGSGPNPEISQKVRQSAQERGRFKKKKKKLDLYRAEVLERWALSQSTNMPGGLCSGE